MRLRARCLGSRWSKHLLAIERANDGFFFDFDQGRFVKGISPNNHWPFKTYTVFTGYKWLDVFAAEGEFANADFNFLLLESQWPFQDNVIAQASTYVKDAPFGYRGPNLTVTVSKGS
jgi:hypothetical protein